MSSPRSHRSANSTARAVLLDRHSIVGQQRDQRVQKVPRRPVPAEPRPLANVVEHLPDVPRTERCTRGVRQPSGSPRCRHASARPDDADPGRFSSGGACHRRAARPGGRRGMLPCPWAPFPRHGGCTGGSRPWLPGLRLEFQKGSLAAKLWWAQVGSNHRPLACKASALPLSYAPLVRAGGAAHLDRSQRTGPTAWPHLAGRAKLGRGYG
jgi:hypothetical protein